MPLQQLSNCNFTVGGSCTNNNILNINVVNHSYDDRGNRTSFRAAGPSISESISTHELLPEAERLQRTANELSHRLKLTSRFVFECNELATTLAEIADETITNIFRFFLNDHPPNIQCQHQILRELVCMQEILDDFATKKAFARHPSGLETTNDLPFDAQCLMTRKSLSVSRDNIYIALFKSMAASFCKRVRSHQIDINDFFGAQWSLPQDLCLNRQVFFSILHFKFQGGPAEVVVTSEQFAVFQQAGRQAIQGRDWENVIKEGDGLQLSVLVNRQSKTLTDDLNALECPGCRQSDKAIHDRSTDGWAHCLRCDTTFNITHKDSDLSSRNLNGINQSNHSSTFRCFSVTVTKVREQAVESAASALGVFNELELHQQTLISYMELHRPP